MRRRGFFSDELKAAVKSAVKEIEPRSAASTVQVPSPLSTPWLRLPPAGTRHHRHAHSTEPSTCNSLSFNLVQNIGYAVAG